MKIKKTLLFLNQFRKRGGIEVFFSGSGSKIVSLLVSIAVARLLSKEEYASISYAVLIVSALLPITGAGMDIVLLRYGAMAEGDTAKSTLFRHTFIRGFLVTMVIVAVLVLLAERICSNQPGAVKFLRILSVLLVGEFLIRMLQNYLRITCRNRHFALTGLLRSVFLLVAVLSLVPLLEGMGYAMAMVAAPLLAVAVFIRYFPQWRKVGAESIEADKGVLFRYGLLIGAGAVLSQLQMRMDGILVGNLLPNPEALAQYRVASLLPVNLLILPAMFFKTEYVHITKHHDQPELVISYLKNYLFLAMIICVALVSGTQVLGESIITLLFGSQYLGSVAPFKVLILGLCGAFLLRQPFGILNNASGRAGLNLVNAFVSVIISILLLLFLIPRYGLMGAATGTAIMFWLSGLLNAILYFTYVYRKLK